MILMSVFVAKYYNCLPHRKDSIKNMILYRPISSSLNILGVDVLWRNAVQPDSKYYDEILSFEYNTVWTKYVYKYMQRFRFECILGFSILTHQYFDIIFVLACFRFRDTVCRHSRGIVFVNIVQISVEWKCSFWGYSLLYFIWVIIWHTYVYKDPEFIQN